MAEDELQIPFAVLMALEPVNNEGKLFISQTPCWAPGGGGVAFGGHVYAQSVYAASHTVPEGMHIHNVHGYFTLPGRTDRPFVYSVEKTSDGRSYCTRQVTVRQTAERCLPFSDSDKDQPLGKVCFSAICSFKKDEPPAVRHQETKNLKKEYAVVLKGKRPQDHNRAPEADAPWFYDLMAKYPYTYNFPGLEMRKVDMRKYNKPKSPLSYKQLLYYRVRGSIPVSDRNLHACAHLFASDRNSLFLIAYALEIPNQINQMGSLSHSVVFHTSSDQVLLPNDTDRNDKKAWFLQEAWTPRSEGGRGIHESKIWNSDGVHIASSWQDGIVRKAEGGIADRQVQKHRRGRILGMKGNSKL